jgi:hypothetical protein
MQEVTDTEAVHAFDPQQHRILCGVRGYEHRSTKHARGVTCEACRELLRERDAAPAAAEPSHAPSGAA